MLARWRQFTPMPKRYEDVSNLETVYSRSKEILRCSQSEDSLPSFHEKIKIISTWRLFISCHGELKTLTIWRYLPSCQSNQEIVYPLAKQIQRCLQLGDNISLGQGELWILKTQIQFTFVPRRFVNAHNSAIVQPHANKICRCSQLETIYSHAEEIQIYSKLGKNLSSCQEDLEILVA